MRASFDRGQNLVSYMAYGDHGATSCASSGGHVVGAVKKKRCVSQVGFGVGESADLSRLLLM